MNSENKFILLKILQEIEFHIKNSHIDFEGLIQMIINKRIFITGAGRTGLIMKSFGIRLMQLGFDVFFIGDTNTPSTSKHDLLIIGSASGETTTISAVARKSKKIGINIILFTSNEFSTIATYAKKIISVGAKTSELEEDSSNKSFQPMSNLFELFLKRGLPCHIRSDNGPEFTAKVVRGWLEKFEIKNLFIEPGSL